MAADAIPDADVEVRACHFSERSYHGDSAHGYGYSAPTRLEDGRIQLSLILQEPDAGLSWLREFEADADLLFFAETRRASFSGLTAGGVLEDPALPGVRLEVLEWTGAGGRLRLTAPNVHHVELRFGEAKGYRLRRAFDGSQRADYELEGSVGGAALEVTQRAEPTRYATRVRALDMGPTAP